MPTQWRLPTPPGGAEEINAEVAGLELSRLRVAEAPSRPSARRSPRKRRAATTARTQTGKS